MACEVLVGAAVTVTLNITLGVWLDSGVTVGAGECLQITAPGTSVQFGFSAGQCAYPEGYYSLAGNPCAVVTYDPASVLATGGGDPPDQYATLEQPPYSLIAKIAAAQPTGTHLTGTLRPNRNTVFPAASLSGGGRVWLAFNDNIFVDNAGSWAVTLQRLSTAPPALPVITTGGGTGQNIKPSPQSEQLYQCVSVAFPGGYLAGVDISAVQTPFTVLTSRVRVRGPYRGYLTGTVLHVVNDAGELADGSALDGVDIFRIGT
jgi:hypothetical protein